MATFQSGRKLDKEANKRDSQIVAELQELYEDCINQMRPQHYGWLLTMSYIAGDQYKYLDVETYQVKEWQRISGYEEREVYNKMRNMKNTYKSRITQKKPAPIATPVTLRERDKRIASITNAVLDDEWEKHHSIDMPMNTHRDVVGS